MYIWEERKECFIEGGDCPTTALPTALRPQLGSRCDWHERLACRESNRRSIIKIQSGESTLNSSFVLPIRTCPRALPLRMPYGNQTRACKHLSRHSCRPETTTTQQISGAKFRLGFDKSRGYTVKTKPARFGERYTCLEYKTKTEVVSIAVNFQHRPLFSRITGKLSTRPLEWYGST